MKLLFDHNLSWRLVTDLADIYPNSAHVYKINLFEVDDRTVWQYAREQDYIIVTKDADFNDLMQLYGYPPKIIWIRKGNCSTKQIEVTLREDLSAVQRLIEDQTVGILSIY